LGCSHFAAARKAGVTGGDVRSSKALLISFFRRDQLWMIGAELEPVFDRVRA